MNLLQPGHIAKSGRVVHERQDGSSSGLARSPVLVIRRRAVPFAQTLTFGTGHDASRAVSVHEGEEVWGEGGVVGLFEAGVGEGSRDKFSGCWVGAFGRLDWMERGASVAGTYVVVSAEE